MVTRLCSRAFSEKKTQRVFLITAGGRGTPVALLISPAITLAYIQHRDRHTREKKNTSNKVINKGWKKISAVEKAKSDFVLCRNTKRRGSAL